MFATRLLVIYIYCHVVCLHVVCLETTASTLIVDCLVSLVSYINVVSYQPHSRLLLPESVEIRPKC